MHGIVSNMLNSKPSTEQELVKIVKGANSALTNEQAKDYAKKIFQSRDTYNMSL